MYSYEIYKKNSRITIILHWFQPKRVLNVCIKSKTIKKQGLWLAVVVARGKEYDGGSTN